MIKKMLMVILLIGILISLSACRGEVTVDIDFPNYHRGIVANHTDYTLKVLITNLSTNKQITISKLEPGEYTKVSLLAEYKYEFNAVHYYSGHWYDTERLFINAIRDDAYYNGIHCDWYVIFRQ
ncbi:MAG: hypothetical protein ACOC2J_01840 [bacterium]